MAGGLPCWIVGCCSRWCDCPSHCPGLGVALGHPKAIPAQEVQGLGSGGHWIPDHPRKGSIVQRSRNRERHHLERVSVSGQKRETGVRNPEERRKRREREETKAALGLRVRNAGQMTAFPSRALPCPRSVGICREETVSRCGPSGPFPPGRSGSDPLAGWLGLPATLWETEASMAPCPVFWPRAHHSGRPTSVTACQTRPRLCSTPTLSLQLRLVTVPLWGGLPFP